jgi:hypothetical protein
LFQRERESLKSKKKGREKGAGRKLAKSNAAAAAAAAAAVVHRTRSHVVIGGHDRGGGGGGQSLRHKNVDDGNRNREAMDLDRDTNKIRPFFSITSSMEQFAGRQTCPALIAR